MLERWLFEIDNCCESTSVTYALRTLFKDSILERLIKTDMVALPVIDQRTTGQSHTTAKLVPRKGASDTWRDEMADILAAHELIDLPLQYDDFIGQRALHAVVLHFDGEIHRIMVKMFSQRVG